MGATLAHGVQTNPSTPLPRCAARRSSVVVHGDPQRCLAIAVACAIAVLHACRVGPDVDVDGGVSGAGMPHDVGEGFGGDAVGGNLDGRGQIG